uniref:Uncharacterized protein n=1 Tax=Arundo donax TaxID=35708 RepID=A0A0A9EK59_ARUDO
MAFHFFLAFLLFGHAMKWLYELEASTKE